MKNRKKRLERWLSQPREKRDKFWRRVDRWQLFILNKYDVGRQLSYDEHLENRKMQIGIQQWNAQNNEGDYD